jgi:uncharacterized protein (UPF0261 family)
MPARIVIAATLDTKGREAGLVRDYIAARGHEPVVVDTGVLGTPAIPAEIPRQEVARAAGTSLDELVRAADRGGAIETMARGLAALVQRLHAEGRLDGILGIGGSAGTAIGTAAMRALPVGVPKVMVSTMASGDTRPYVGTKDITMMYSVVDVAGINRLSRRILANAAGAICGMVEAREAGAPTGEEKPLIAATMFGVTTPCVTRARELLEANGFEVLVFHATGTGGQAMEGLIEDGFIAGVLDITTTEWADELVGGVLSAGPHRLEAAGRKGIPQVVSVGALDMVNFGPPETVPEKFRGRKFYQHNPQVTLMRTTVEENRELGRIIAEKLNQATGPTALYLPLRGVSLYDTDDGPFVDEAARAALFEAIRTHLDRSKVKLVEMDVAINDPPFAEAMARELMAMLGRA